MKRTFRIIGRDDDGRVCVMTLETDKPWLPMRAEDVKDNADFAPRAIHEVQIEEEDGRFRQLILNTIGLSVTDYGRKLT